MSPLTTHELAHHLAQLDLTAASELGNGAQHIGKLVTTLGTALQSADAAWKGDDADRFLAQWRRHLAKLVDIQHKLLASATELQDVAANRYRSLPVVPFGGTDTVA